MTLFTLSIATNSLLYISCTSEVHFFTSESLLHSLSLSFPLDVTKYFQQLEAQTILLTLKFCFRFIDPAELNWVRVDQHLSGISLIIGLASLGPHKNLQCELVMK